MKTAVNTENANESPKILQALKASFGIKPRRFCIRNESWCCRVFGL